MEKNTKSNLRKGLLMATACVLVAAISISATLSYLTAKSNTKTNVFQSESGIEGKLNEPHFNMDQTNYFSPGERVDKDPVVVNTSSADASMWTGIRLTYFINPSNTGWVQVSESTFRKFVEIYQTTTATDGKTGVDLVTSSTATGYNDTASDSSNKWTEMKWDPASTTTAITSPTPTNVADFSAQGKYNSLAKYFKYNETVAQNASTKAIFGSVQAKGAICIPETDDAKGTHTIKFNGDTITNGGSTKYSSLEANSDARRTFLATVGDSLDTYYFTSFDFEIDIDGYGVKYDSGNASADELGDVIQTITDGLAGM